MLYIEKGARVPLPRKYRPINNTSAHIYDQLVAIIKDDLFKSFGEVELDHLLMDEFDVSRESVLDFLVRNGDKVVVREVLIKRIASGVIADLANFVYESISAAKRGKLTVAYALLRKPFTDELLILERLLTESDKFIDEFYYDRKGDEKYDPVDFRNRKSDIKTIINDSVFKINSELYSSDLLYKLRYDGESHAGIYGESQRALHIVTNGNGYATEMRNLNFVFSNENDMDSQWKHFYFVMPYLLIYTCSVVDCIYALYLKTDQQQHAFNSRSIKRFFGIIQWLNQSNWNKDKERLSVGRKIRKLLKHKCDCCNHINSVDKYDMDLYFEAELLICKKCFRPYSLQ
ncbi:hypothetical protein [Paraflavitalea pollutisoli]|uniref:hypothetical protein n=1 Tax=Paraflavitalea pollutisoli TaxID=3034143 RepID=UPI0023EE078B|nr:hypothetical protein [Paraflavitalea sp. H1-2-19X]